MYVVDILCKEMQVIILHKNWSKMADPLTPLSFNWVCIWTFKCSINSFLELNQWLKGMGSIPIDLGSLYARQSYKHYYDKNSAISVHMYLSIIALLKIYFKPKFYHDSIRWIIYNYFEIHFNGFRLISTMCGVIVKFRFMFRVTQDMFAISHA